MDKNSIHKALLIKFDAPKGYSVDSYYGTAIMKLKKNNKYQIKLLYDYSKHAQTSNSIYFDTVDGAMRAFVLLEEFSKDGKEKSLDDELSEMFGTD